MAYQNIETEIGDIRITAGELKELQKDMKCINTKIRLKSDTMLKKLNAILDRKLFNLDSVAECVAVPSVENAWDFAGCTFMTEGRPIRITGHCLTILQELTRVQPKPVTYDRLINLCWGMTEDVENAKANLAVHMCRLREALSKTPFRIKNHWGFGQSFVRVRDDRDPEICLTPNKGNEVDPGEECDNG